MKITREKHMAHLVRLMPFLLLAVVVQGLVYQYWVPRDMALDVSIFMGIGIALIGVAYGLYDHFHQVRLYPHFLQVRFDLMGQFEEVLYRDITDMKVEVTRQAYYNVTLLLRDGSNLKLRYLDDVQELKSYLKGVR